MTKEIFASSQYRLLLEENQLGRFDSLWALQAELAEKPNERRKGWSEAVKYRLRIPDGGDCGIFIKRQQNHKTWHPFHPFSGVPTLYREWKNIRSLVKIGVSAPEVLYYGEKRQKSGATRAILVSRELEGYIPFDEWMHSDEAGDLTNRRAVFQTIAKAVKKIHANHFQYSCLYPRHILIKSQKNLPEPDKIPVFDFRFIDLEKMRKRLFRFRASVSDLEQLHRRFKWDRDDWTLFLELYTDSRTSRDMRLKLQDAVSERSIRKSITKFGN